MKFRAVVLLIFIVLIVAVGAYVVSAQTVNVECAETYTVVAGDWLSNAAGRFLGDVDTYQAIFIATNLKAKTDSTYTTLTDPNIIEVGSKLCIPAQSDVPKLLATNLFPTPQPTALATVSGTAPTVITAPITATLAISPTAVLTGSPTITPVLTTIPLRPEDVTFTPYGLGNKIQGLLVPYAPFDNSEPPGPVGAPAHIAFQFDGVERLWVIPAQAYRAQWDNAGNGTVARALAQLDVLQRDQPAAPVPPLPMLPPDNATNDLAARVRYLAFDGGTGFSFIGRSAQDPSPVLSSQLYYSFLGLTNDNKYIVSFRFPIESSMLPKTIGDLTPAHLAEIQADPHLYFQETTDLLNKLKTSDFGPDLTRLDALVFSIHVPSTGTIAPHPTGGAVTPGAVTGNGAETPLPTSAEDPAALRKQLLANEWKWLETTTITGTITVGDPDKYSIRFNGANGFGISSDCNIGAGNFTEVGGLLTIKDLQSTKVACGDASLDMTFTSELLSAESFVFADDTLLIVLKDNGGTMKFSKKISNP